MSDKKQIPDEIWERLMRAEGGGKYHNKKGDGGGATKFGISQRAFPEEDIKNLTEERARELATKNYWNKLPETKRDYRTFQEYFNTGRYGDSIQEKIKFYTDLYRKEKTKSGTNTRENINGWMNQAIGADNGQIFSNSKINAKDMTPDELYHAAMEQAKKLNPEQFTDKPTPFDTSEVTDFSPELTESTEEDLDETQQSAKIAIEENEPLPQSTQDEFARRINEEEPEEETQTEEVVDGTEEFGEYVDGTEEFGEYTPDAEPEPEEPTSFFNRIFKSRVKPSKIEEQPDALDAGTAGLFGVSEALDDTREEQISSAKDLGSLAAGAVDAATFGLADEAVGLVSDEGKEKVRDLQKAAQEQNPALFIAGNILAGIGMGNPVGAVGSKAASILGLAKQAKALPSAIKTGAIGASEGQLYGMGSSEKDFSNDAAGVIKDGINEALVGGAFGGAIGGLLDIGKAASKTPKAKTPKKKKTAPETKSDLMVDDMDFDKTLRIVGEEEMQDVITQAERAAAEDFDKNRSIVISMSKTLEDKSLVKLLKAKGDLSNKVNAFHGGVIGKVDPTVFNNKKVPLSKETKKLMKDLDEDKVKQYATWRQEVLGYVRWLSNSEKGKKSLKSIYTDMKKVEKPLDSRLEEVIDKLNRGGKITPQSYNLYKTQQNIAESFYKTRQQKITQSLADTKDPTLRKQVAEQVKEELVEGDPLGLVGRKWLNANTVAEVVDAKAGTDVQELVYKAKQAQNLKTSWEIPFKESISEAQKLRRSYPELSDEMLVQIIESGNKHPVADAYRKAFQNVREEANKMGVKIEEYSLGQDRYVKMKKKSGANLIVAFENKYKELQDEIIPLLKGDIKDPKTGKLKERLRLAIDKQKETKELKNFLEEHGGSSDSFYKEQSKIAKGRLVELKKEINLLLDGKVGAEALEEVDSFRNLLSKHLNRDIKDLEGLEQAMKDIRSKTSVSNSFNPQISALFSRGKEPLPLWIRETNLNKLVQQNVSEVGNTIFMQPIADLIDTRTPYLKAIGMEDSARYFNTYRNDIMGIRRESASDAMQQMKGRLEVALSDSELGKFSLGLWNYAKSALYPNFLGNNPAAIIRNLSQPLTMTLPELGYAYAPEMAKHIRNTLLDAVKNRAKFNADRKKLAEVGILMKRDLKPEDMEGIKVGFKEYFKDSGFADKADKFIDSYNDIVMKGYTMSDTLNRMATAKMTSQMVDELFEGSERAMAAVKRTPKSVQKSMQKAMDAGLGKNAIKEILMRHYDVQTQLAYGKMDMNELGRDLGPLFTMLTKWPVSISGDVYKKIKLGGSKGLSDSAKKYMYPLIAGLAIDNIADSEDPKYKGLVGGRGVAGWMPINSILGNDVNDWMPIPTIGGAVRMGNVGIDYLMNQAKGGRAAEKADERLDKATNNAAKQFLPVAGSVMTTLDRLERLNKDD